jgi:hypothetical protein
MHDTYIHLSTMQKSRVCTTGSAIHTSTSTRAEEQSMYHGLRDQYTHHNTYRGAGKYHMLREQYTNHSTCKHAEYLSRVPRSMHTHQYIQKSRVCIPRLNMLSIFRKLLGSCQNCGVLCSNFSMGHHHHNTPFRHHPFVVIFGDPPWSSADPCMHCACSMHISTCMQPNHTLIGYVRSSRYMVQDCMPRPYVKSNHLHTLTGVPQGSKRGPTPVKPPQK